MKGEINFLEQQPSMGKYVPGINYPYDSGTTTNPSAILDSGAHFTFVNDRQLQTNSSPPSSPVVQVADGSLHQDQIKII